MRTKTLLAAAAMIAAGVLSSEAQSNVYSLNVVGYINVTLVPGYNLVTDQLIGGPTSINVALTNVPGLAEGSVKFGWDLTAKDLAQQDTWIPSEGKWFDAGGNESTGTVAPGQGFFIRNDSANNVTMTLVGEVKQGQTIVPIVTNPAGVNNYNLLGSPVPVVSALDTNGFPLIDDSTIQTFIPGVDYSPTMIIAGGVFYDAGGNPIPAYAPAVGQGFLVNFPAAGVPSSWTRNFTVQ